VAGAGEVVERLRGHSGRLGERLLGCAAGLGWGDAAGGDEVVLEGEGAGELETRRRQSLWWIGEGSWEAARTRGRRRFRRRSMTAAAEGRRRRRWVSLRGQI